VLETYAAQAMAVRNVFMDGNQQEQKIDSIGNYVVKKQGVVR
jgi:hypothetical protein